MSRLRVECGTKLDPTSVHLDYSMIFVVEDSDYRLSYIESRVAPTCEPLPVRVDNSTPPVWWLVLVVICIIYSVTQLIKGIRG